MIHPLVAGIESVHLFDDDLVRLTFVVGIAISVLTYERTHRTTGSLVVPGYIGASLLSPVALIATAVNALITWYLVAQVLPRFVAIFGRTLFVVNIFVSVTLSLLLGPVAGSALPGVVPQLDTIGYVVPALIAYDMNRQGVLRTGTTVFATGLLAAVPALVLIALRPDVVDPLIPADTVLRGIGEFWMAVTALVSVGVATVLNAGHGLRSGGFISAMYIGLMATEPVAIAFIIVMAITTFGVVEFGLKKMMIVFGRRKFAIVLMVGSVLSWAVLLAGDPWLPPVLGLDDLPIAVLFVPALLANDMERTSVPEGIVGTALAAVATVSIVVVMSGFVDHRAIPYWAPPAILVSAVVLFLPAIRRRIDELPRPRLDRGSLDFGLPLAQQV